MSCIHPPFTHNPIYVLIITVAFITLCTSESLYQEYVAGKGSQDRPYGVGNSGRGRYDYQQRGQWRGFTSNRKMYFAIASSQPSSTQTYSRAFNKSLSNITQSYLNNVNITAETLVIELPEHGRFSSRLLETVCEQFSRARYIVAVLVVGHSAAARTVALVATSAGVPVLWASEDSNFAPDLVDKQNNELVVRLQPGARETLEAIRALLAHAHWHAFTILADDSPTSSVLLSKELSAILHSQPLSPSVLYLPRQAHPHLIFRRLADISRATRGVVILLSDLNLARRILAEARRLNMDDGHFVWLWIDTSVSDASAAILDPVNTTRSNYDSFDSMLKQQSATGKDKQRKVRDTDDVLKENDTVSFSSLQEENENKTVKVNESKVEKKHKIRKRQSFENLVPNSDHLSDMHVNYLLRNDKFLLFTNHHNNGVESSKFSDTSDSPVVVNKRNSDFRRAGGSSAGSMWSFSGGSEDDWGSDGSAGLPVGLLAFRPQPIRVDRHLVKGGMRLLAATLRAALAVCPESLAGALFEDMVQAKRLTNCLDLPTVERRNFSMIFARELRETTRLALAGHKILQENGVEKVDKSLVSNFEITNLVPEQSAHDGGGAADGAPETFVGDRRGSSGSSGGAWRGPYSSQQRLMWRTVGHVTGRAVHLDTIVWPGGDVVAAGLSARARSVFRVVTALAPPFVMESSLDEDGQCLRGLPCHRVLTSDKDNLTLVFNEMETNERLEEEEEDHFDFRNEYGDHDRFLPFRRYKYTTNCCYGLAMDLLENVAQELEFDFRLYIVADGRFGAQIHKSRRYHRDLSLLNKNNLNYRYQQDGLYKHYNRDSIKSGMYNKEDIIYNRDLYEDDDDVKWNGIVGDLMSGAAHMSFAALSVSSIRSEVIDFSAPYFFSGVSFLAAPQQTSDIPLLAFLLPFSPELWIAIFTSLNITAVAVAIYEWLSPFGLNPWGRQRSKNFSMSSALWVMWGLLCGHLVAFKAPKSWPNKFLINVWGGFSVIFVASYTANIAALIAGLFFHNAVSNYHDRSLLSQKVGAPMSSAAEYYVQRANRHLWDHMHRFSLDTVEEGVERLRNGSLDILIADTPILDYYRATDHNCKLQKIGDTINEDVYAVGMTKGFPLKDSISAVISKYASNGYIDILQEKWYGGLPCFKLVQEMSQPRPLGVAAVTGVFILLGLGMIVGLLILLFEHLFYRYTLPILRHQPKGTIWRSRNIMFFSQKLYRFINCVELVSPHHAARELVHTLRQGQITSLFQKSVKRKEHEQRRRRKSKAQFFEMIQEIRRVQQEERDHCGTLEAVTEVETEDTDEPTDEKRSKISPNILRRHFMRSNPKIDVAASPNPKSPSKRIFGKPIFSPRSKTKAKSSTNLNVRRFSTDSVFSSKVDTSSAIGRRLSKDIGFLSGSPPDINSRRSSNLDVAYATMPRFSVKSPVLSIENVSDISTLDVKTDLVRKLSDAENIGRKLATMPKYKDLSNRSSLKVDDSFTRRKSDIIISKTTDGNLRLNSDVFSQDFDVATVKSCQNIPSVGNVEAEKRTDSVSSEINLNIEPKCILSDDEIARRNKQTIEQLNKQLFKGKQKSKMPMKRTQSNDTNPTSTFKMNPQIRIEIEDTSKTSDSVSDNPIRPIDKTTTLYPGKSSSTGSNRKPKHRHRSLGESGGRQKKLPDHSQSLDSCSSSASKSRDDLNVTDSQSASSSRSRSPSPRCKEHDLPPAPPPPNCSPRNSNGKSPLDRLSKEELVSLWRSSESELRSHLLKALREKDVDDPP